MELSELLESPRDVVAHFHLEAGRAWRLQGAPKQRNSHLVYAALELRCAIERFVLQIYLMMDPQAEQTPERFRDFTSLVKLVHAEAGDGRKLWRILTFNAVFGRVVFGLPFEMAEPRVGAFQGMWSRLSELCHRQLSVASTWGSPEWVATGYATVEEAEALLWDVLRTKTTGWIHPRTMPDEMQREREHFLLSDDTADVLERRLSLIKPVVKARLDLAKGGA